MCLCARKGRVARKVVIVLPRADPIKVTGGIRLQGASVAITPGVGPEARDQATTASTVLDLGKAGDRYEGNDLR